MAAKAVSTGRSRRGWSFYGTWRSCPRKWAFIYLEGRDPIVNGGPLAIGTMVHELLAATLLKRMGQEAHATDARIEDSDGLGLHPHDWAMKRLLRTSGFERSRWPVRRKTGSKALKKSSKPIRMWL